MKTDAQMKQPSFSIVLLSSLTLIYLVHLVLINAQDSELSNSWIRNYFRSGKHFANAFNFYVSPKGSDSNPGTLTQPFATIQRAQQAVRLKKLSWNGPITVFLRGGYYFVNSTITLTSADSGNSADEMITYSGYPSETATLSGGAVITCPKWESLSFRYSARPAYSNIKGQVAPGNSTATIKYLGKTSSFQECINRLQGRYLSYVWHGVSKDTAWNMMCYGRTDNVWTLIPSENAVSGQRVTPFRCHLPQLKTSNEGFSTLFVNGERYWRARYPNEDKVNYTVWGGNGYVNATRGFGGSQSNPPRYPAQPPTGLAYDPKTFSPFVGNWTHVDDAIVHVFPSSYWGNVMFSVDSVNVNNNTIWFRKGGGQINLYRYNSGADIGWTSRFFVESIFEELDAPGEFFVDKYNGYLYIIPEEGVDLDTATIINPILKRIIEFRGESIPVDTRNPKVYVQHVALANLTFAHTAATYLEPYEVPSNGDWTIHRSGTVYFETAQNCAVHNCLFDKVGGNAIFVFGAAYNISIDHNDIVAPGDSGVCFLGSRWLSTGSSLIFPSRCSVTNNYMVRIGYYGKQTAGVFVSNSDRILISNNLIHEIPRAGILINDEFCGGHTVEYNYVYDCVKETRDHGPFNSWGRERFWSEIFNHPEYVPQGGVPTQSPAGPVWHDVIWPVTVRNNFFFYYAVYDPWGAPDAIDMDDGSSMMWAYENVCIGSSVKVGSSGDYHYVYNNIFIDGGVPFLWDNMMFNKDFIYSNIFYYTTPIGDFMLWGIASTLLPRQIDKNLYYAPNTTNYVVGWNNAVLSLTSWQKEQVMDVNSLFGEDPQFFNVQEFNFTVKPTSPAFKIGFHNFRYGNQGPVGRFGSPYVRNARLNESLRHYEFTPTTNKNIVSTKNSKWRWPRISQRIF